MDELVKESVKDLRKKLSEVRKKACPKVSGMKKPEVVAEILYLEAEAKRREESKEAKEKVVEEASKHKPERGRYTSKRKAMVEKQEAPVEKPVAGVMQTPILAKKGKKQIKEAEPVAPVVDVEKQKIIDMIPKEIMKSYKKKQIKEAEAVAPAGKPAKGSPEMKEKMAKLRAMRKKKEEK